MNLKECVKGSIQQLLSNKMRTFLTMLGMFIGIGSVILILSVGEGVKGSVSGIFDDVGKGTIQLKTNNYESEYMITKEDLDVIREMPEVKTALAYDEGYGTTVKTYRKEDKRLVVSGVPHNIKEVQKVEIVAGRMFSEAEDTMKARVILVSDKFAKVVYGKSDPNYALGETIELNLGGQTNSFEIIGLTKTKTFPGAPEDQIPIIAHTPFSTIDQITGLGDQRTYMAAVMVKEGYDPGEIGYQIQRLMDKRHATEDGYSAQSVTQIMDEINKVMSTITTFIGLVASISLLVGGIGIMNIMLVTVKERTREIGIRKAIGATNSEILRQFLIEAIILTLLGGIIGMLLGYFGGLAVGAVAKIDVKLTLPMIVFSVGTSSVIGILFGVYPAYQASKLDPVEALRYE